jgi:hypothetical protein
MAKSVTDIAIASINAQIADLNRAKDIILQAAGDHAEDAAPRARKPRGKNKPKPGLPVDAGI